MVMKLSSITNISEKEINSLICGGDGWCHCYDHNKIEKSNADLRLRCGTSRQMDAMCKNHCCSQSNILYYGHTGGGGGGIKIYPC